MPATSTMVSEYRSCRNIQNDLIANTPVFFQKVFKCESGHICVKKGHQF